MHRTRTMDPRVSATLHLRSNMKMMIQREVDRLFEAHVESHYVHDMLVWLFAAPTTQTPLVRLSKPLAYAMHETSRWSPEAAVSLFREMRQYVSRKYGRLAAATHHTECVENVLRGIQQRGARRRPALMPPS